ncbi:DUF2845 domain-containing protein [Pseudomonas sp. MM211]|uniref:DUF2845 domain-containing protein n=1 Tax=Pseudomonas sp. MM211 TaxID=2866808 RepID=UPI001CED98D5|nr:DUF2845 domain-containing protein [Pseudomonas sp. MM211]UCJ14972.1 DUF2845 domain-containing protein [Pseudomonas sp. MM211]
MNRSLLLLALLFAAVPSLASMRCGTSLINLGDTVDRVQAICGTPAQRRIETPDRRHANPHRANSVEVQYWSYGPNNGAVRNLRFIEGKLVEISTERQR